MTGNFIRDVEVLDRGDLDFAETGDPHHTTTSGAEEVSQDPVVCRVCVDEAAGHDATGFEPFVLLGYHGGAEQVDVLHKTDGTTARELLQRREDDSCS